MRSIFFVVALISVAFASVATRADDNRERVSHRLLAVSGMNLKWGDPELGSPAVIRYAFANASVSRTEARNCRNIEAFPGQMKNGGLPFDRLAAEFHAAFEAWEEVANIRFVYVTDPADADVVVGTQKIPRGIAFADVNYTTSRSASLASIKKGAICLNPEVLWTAAFDQDELTYDVRYVAMHEIGHVLGLNHTWSKADSIMGFRYRETIRKPQPGDIAGVRLLYGPRTTRAAVALPAPSLF